MSGQSSGEQSHWWATGGVRVRDRFTAMKASFFEYLSAREDWVQDILGYQTKSLPCEIHQHKTGLSYPMPHTDTYKDGQACLLRQPTSRQQALPAFHCTVFVLSPGPASAPFVQAQCCQHLNRHEYQQGRLVTQAPANTAQVCMKICNRDNFCDKQWDYD